MCSFFSLLWTFFNTNVLVNSLPRSQSSQASSGLVSTPKKQFLWLGARRWHFPTLCLWGIPGSWQVWCYRRCEFWKNTKNKTFIPNSKQSLTSMVDLKQSYSNVSLRKGNYIFKMIHFCTNFTLTNRNGWSHSLNIFCTQYISIKDLAW